jgi:hypothetical protein
MLSLRSRTRQPPLPGTEHEAAWNRWEFFAVDNGMSDKRLPTGGGAEAIFSAISDEHDIVRLIDEAEAERLHLDFKRRPQPGDLRKVLGKALSGFANSDGGVLVFGVREQNGAWGADPIADLAAFESQVNELLARAVSYPVPGVQTKRVPASETSGYLAVLVPQSDLAPHQAVDTKHYHRRHGDSFPPMEHYEVADAFGLLDRTYRPAASSR